MPSRHNRGTAIRTETTPARSTSGLEDTGCVPSQKPTLPQFFTRRTDRITTLLQATVPQDCRSKSPWASCAALLTQRDTLRSILERGQLLSRQKKMSPFFHDKPPLSSLQVQKSPNPGPHNHQVTQGGCHLYKQA